MEKPFDFFSVPLEKAPVQQPGPATFQTVDITWIQMVERAQQVCPHQRFIVIDIERSPTAQGSMEKLFHFISLGMKEDVQPGLYQMEYIGLKLGGQGTVASLYYIPATAELFAWDKKNQKMFKAK